jgi:hypothetical protein
MHVAERKKQQLTESVPKNGQSRMATVNKPRAASVEDTDNTQSFHCANPNNPNTIIESLDNDDEIEAHVTGAAPKKGKSSRAALVEDIEDIEDIQSSHRAKPRNPTTIIESSEDDDEVEVLAPTQNKQQQRVPQAAPKTGKSSQAASVEGIEDINNIQSSHCRKPKNPNTIIESLEGEDEIDQSESEKLTESAKAELSEHQSLLIFNF